MAYFLSVPDAPVSGMQHFIARYSLYLFPYAFAFFLQYLFFPQLTYHKSRWFWFLLLLAPAFFSVRTSFSFYQNYLEKEWITGLRAKYPVTVNEDVLNSFGK